VHAIIIDSRGDPPDRTPSRWCLFTRNEQFASQPEVQRAFKKGSPKEVAVWTDRFSNLFQLLK
jgi:hypothetical protein